MELQAWNSFLIISYNEGTISYEEGIKTRGVVRWRKGKERNSPLHKLASRKMLTHPQNIRSQRLRQNQTSLFGGSLLYLGLCLICYQPPPRITT